MTQNKSDSIDLILQCGRVVDKNCCVVLPASGFPYLIQSPRQYKRKVATTYLAIKIYITSNIAITEKNNNFIIFIRRITR